MGDLLGIGASGVRAYQTALSVVGENIANASTPGYTRREVRLNQTGAANAAGVAGLDRGAGGGVLVGGIGRSVDVFKTAAARVASSDVAASETAVTYLGRVEQALAGSGASASLTRFFNSAQALAADPAGIAARTQFLSDAQGVAQSFNGTAGALSTIAADLGQDTAATVDSLNGLTANLARLNASLATARPGTDSAAAIADQRDGLLDRIASLAPISTSLDSRGVATVRLNGANGPLLVGGASAGLVKAETNPSGTVAFTMVRDGTTDPVAINGGALAGLADASTRVADARASLDTVANGFAAAVNASQGQGVDLDGAAGKPMFATGYATTAPLPGSSGGASIAASLAADATPAAGGYTAVWNKAAGEWTVARADGSAQMSGTGTLTLDGVSVTLGGAPAAGDGFSIDTASGAAGMSAAALQPREVAAAAKWTVDAPIGNTGTGAVSVTPSDATGLPKKASYALAFDDGKVSISDPATGKLLATKTYSAGMTIAGAGFSLVLSGQFKDGDRISILPTAANSNDNGNLAALARLRTSGGFEGRVDAVTQKNAAALAAKKSLADAQGAIRDNAFAARDEVSGVNLDAEAVSLMKFQQAYQASSRVIQVAREIFQNILDVV